jgi:peptidoglycan/xylan/chitin deacetylase (PgdA/CDA1 family)
VASLSIDEVMWKLIHKGEKLGSEQSRQALLTNLSELLEVDIAVLHEKHLLSLLSSTEVATLANQDFDIQLHTHRHRLPIDDRQSAHREIEENRTRLEAITGRPARHLCYPSGIYGSSQWPWLEELRIESATTCLPGLNTVHTPRYALRRFLDSEDIRFIEFKAELAGFNHLLRMLRGRVWVSEGSRSL